MPGGDNVITSFAKAKADRAVEARDWTPRDALMQLLQEMDEGKQVDRLIIFHATVDAGGGSTTGYIASTPDAHATMGLIEMGKAEVIFDVHEEMRKAGR